MTRRTARFWAYLVLAASIAIVVGSILLPASARAHTAPAGWDYDPSCCNGNDCAQIPSSAVKVTSSGYLVTLRPGDHPMVTRERVFLVPFKYSGIKDSGDEYYHICFCPDQDNLRCFYRPQMSF